MRLNPCRQDSCAMQLIRIVNYRIITTIIIIIICSTTNVLNRRLFVGNTYVSAISTWQLCSTLYYCCIIIILLSTPTHIAVLLVLDLLILRCHDCIFHHGCAYYLAPSDSLSPFLPPSFIHSFVHYLNNPFSLVIQFKCKVNNYFYIQYSHICIRILYRVPVLCTFTQLKRLSNESRIIQDLLVYL